MKSIRLYLLALIGVLAFVACPAATALGTLDVAVSGLPTGINPDLRVGGPNGFDLTLSGPQTLGNLEPGTYILTAKGTPGYSAIVTGSPASVTTGGTVSASVTYTATTLVTPGTPGTLGTGALKVNLTGLPSGTKATVAISGPNGFGRTLPDVIGSVVIADLAAGTYAVAASPIRLVAPVVDLLFDGVSLGAVNVTVQATSTVTLNYVPRPGTPALWLPKAGGSAIAFASRSLGFGGNSLVQPNITLNGAGGGGNSSVTFDAKGNLWALSSVNNTLKRFDAAQLGSSGTPTAAITITSSAGSLTRPASMTFDAAGNLWVANLGNDTLVMFAASQLSASGSPIPALIIGPNPNPLFPTLHGVSSLAFDQGGNLWVLNASTPETLARLSPEQIARSGTPVPSVTINLGLSAASNIAFDAAGDLWITDSGASTVVRYAAAQLTQGNPSPMATIRDIAGSLSSPSGLAFDSSGNLWVTNIGNSTLVEFASDTLPTTPNADSPEAASTISNIRDLALGSIAFNPAPLNLPLAH